MEEYLQLCLFLFLIASSVIIYSQIRCAYPDFKDPLGIHSELYIDGWLLSHFITFGIVGYVFPTHFYLAMILGVLWEIFEYLLGKNTPTFLKCKIQNKNKPKYQYLFKTNDSNIQTKNDAWWYARHEDIIVDFLGFVTGYFIKTYSF